MSGTKHTDALVASVQDIAAALRAAERSAGDAAAVTLAHAEAVVAARLQLFTRLIELGWTPPADVATAKQADAALLAQRGGAIGG